MNSIVSPSFRRYERLLLAVFAFIFLSGIISPPSLMDDVDGAQAQMARKMLETGDWVSARLDGVLFIEKAPLKYWCTAVAYAIFGVHDWVARLPNALAGIALCWLIVRFGRWAISEKAGLYAGLFLSTSLGLFLFTRIVIPDIILTLWVALALWSALRAIDDEEPAPGLWATLLAVSLALAMLTKGLVGVALPVMSFLVFLVATGRLFKRELWRRLHVLRGLLIFLVIAAPWHVLAILHNPPYFDFTLHGYPFKWRGFFWFYFVNDQFLRFLNERYPRDYNTVPRLAFWLLHLLWLFPWSLFCFEARRLSFRRSTRRGQARILLLSWVGFVMIFFTFSTTQEYYSMPIYPALALLLGSAVSVAPSLRWSARAAGAVAALAAIATFSLLVIVRGLPTPGDISHALTENPNAYTLSMGHMQDLTINSFAYLRVPLAIAAIAFSIGAIGAWLPRKRTQVIALAAMMILFFQAARLALVTFDPYLTSKPLADALQRAPKGQLMSYGEYYNFSSMLFYTNQKTLMINGRYFNLEYGSYAPGAPDVFINDDQFRQHWTEKQQRWYLAITADDLPKLKPYLAGTPSYQVVESGGKYLFTNQPL